MFQKETKTRFSQLLNQVNHYSEYQFGLWEKQIATQRNLLGSIEEFEPYCAFHRIAKNKHIGVPELTSFLFDNGIQQSQDQIIRLIQAYSQNCTDQWNYQDFLRLVLSFDNQKLRNKIVSKNPGLLDPGEKLNLDIEYGLSKLFLKEIEAIKNLEHQKILLMKCKDYSPEQAFFKIDVNGNNLMDIETLKNYLNTFTHQIDDDLLIYIIHYMDRDGDGVVNFEDFCNLVYPQEKFAKTKTSQTKANIVKNFINLNKTSQFNSQQMTNVGKKSLASSKMQHGYDSLSIHKELCFILKEIINTEKALEIQRQDLYLCVDFDPQILFRYVDSSNTGLVTQIQFEEWLNTLEMFPDPQQLFLFFQRYDADKDGRLQFSDFLDAVQPKQKEYTSICTLRRTNDQTNVNEFLIIRILDLKLRIQLKSYQDQYSNVKVSQKQPRQIFFRHNLWIGLNNFICLIGIRMV